MPGNHVFLFAKYSEETYLLSFGAVLVVKVGLTKMMCFEKRRVVQGNISTVIEGKTDISHEVNRALVSLPGITSASPLTFSLKVSFSAT